MNLKPRSRVNKRKMKKMKAVRKDIEDYKNMIFAAFETKSVLTQIEIVRRCNGEKWAFLRPAVHIICDLHDRGANGRSWILKAEFRLNTDIV